MAFKITFKAKELTKKLDKYSPKSIRFVSYRSIEDLGPQLRNKNIKERYKKLFIDPVEFTLNSLLFKNYEGKAKIDFFTFSDESKTNPPSKYLYPVIGGGSSDVYETRFTKWLKANKYMRRNQFPLANRAYKSMILTGSNNRVLPSVYANTQRALRKTDAKALKYNSQGSNIQDARVFAMKESFPKKAKKNKNKYKPGIYRVSTKGGSRSGTFLKPLFRFITPKPKVRRKSVTFYDILTQESTKELPKLFERNLKTYGR